MKQFTTSHCTTNYAIQNNRQFQFDMLKGIGIILVMLGHAIPADGFVHNWIYGFHMPLFFACSGFFFKDKPLWEGTLKDVKALLMPWLTFSLFLVCCSLILQHFSNGAGPIFQPLDENCWILYYTIWFLIALFIVKLLYRGITKLHSVLFVNVIIWGGVFLCDSN